MAPETGMARGQDLRGERLSWAVPQVSLQGCSLSLTSLSSREHSPSLSPDPGKPLIGHPALPSPASQDAGVLGWGRGFRVRPPGCGEGPVPPGPAQAPMPVPVTRPRTRGLAVRLTRVSGASQEPGAPAGQRHRHVRGARGQRVRRGLVLGRPLAVCLPELRREARHQPGAPGAQVPHPALSRPRPHLQPPLSPRRRRRPRPPNPLGPRAPHRECLPWGLCLSGTLGVHLQVSMMFGRLSLEIKNEVSKQGRHAARLLAPHFRRSVPPQAARHALRAPAAPSLPTSVRPGRNRGSL